MANTPPIVLTFAASDPTSGAGIQADLLTLAAMGCHPLTVITAITVQDSLGVTDVFVLDAEWIADQARSVLEDMPVAVFKIGMLGSVEIIAAIAEIVGDYPDIPLILDPVLSSGRGDELASEDMIAALCKMLIPQTTLITPNSMEARRLTVDEDSDDSPSLDECAARLIGLGCEYALITGTHENTPQVINTLYGEEGRLASNSWQRLSGSFHGSGCTLASAIAAAVAQGMDIRDATKDAQDFTWRALKAGFRPGMGQYIPDRLFWARDVGAEHD